MLSTSAIGKFIHFLYDDCVRYVIIIVIFIKSLYWSLTLKVTQEKKFSEKEKNYYIFQRNIECYLFHFCFVYPKKITLFELMILTS